MRNRLKSLRKKRRIKQYRLASKVGIHPSKISFIEHGLIPDNKLKRKLAKALNCEISDLFSEE